MNYRQDDKLDEAVEKVRKRFHTKRLDGITFVCLYQDEPVKKQGREFVATITKLQDLPKYAFEQHLGVRGDFLIRVHEAAFANLPKKSQTAELDQQLMKCTIETNTEGDRVPKTVGCPVQTFPQIVKRHGAWTPALREVANELKQLRLLPEDEGNDQEQSEESAA